MIFLRFFIFTLVGLAFADETRDIEITFKDGDTQHCSVKCPRFPSNIILQHNPTCEFLFPTTTSTFTSPTTTTTPPPSTTSTSTKTTPSTTYTSTKSTPSTTSTKSTPSTTSTSPTTPPPPSTTSTSPTTPPPPSTTSTKSTPSTTSTKSTPSTTSTKSTPSTTSTKSTPSTTSTKSTPSTTSTKSTPSTTSTKSTPSTTSTSPTTPPPPSTTSNSPTPRSNLCGEIKKQVCLNGDPHYRTFDGSHFEYQGTCPHIFVERCNGTDDFDYFSVKVKNQKFGKVSVIQSAQIELFYQTIFINLDPNFYINGIKESYPFNLNVSLNKHISIMRYENKISILSTNNNESGIQVYLDAHTLCVDIPDCPEYFGTDKLCGLAGSYNGYCGDDLVYRDKTMFEDQGYPCRYGNKVNKWANSWTTNDYFWPSKNKTCEAGVDVDTVEDRKCDDAIHVCEPIRSALKGIKAFAQCKVLDYSEIYSEYGKCVDHICEKNIPKCDALQKFADFCGSRLNDVQLKPWRKELHCSDEDYNEQTFFVN